MGGIADKRRGLGTAEVLALISSAGLALTSSAPQTVGSANAVGTGTEAARDDHVHDHGVHTTGDLHTNYQLESEKGAANGYAELDGSTQVPAAQAPAKAVYSTGGGQALAPEDINASTRWNGEVFGSVQTTNATPTTCATVLVPDNKALLVMAWIACRRTTGAEAAGYMLMGLFRRSGGTVTQVGGTGVQFEREDVAGWAAALVISGTDVLVQVTGAGGSTIDWRARVELQQAP